MSPPSLAGAAGGGGEAVASVREGWRRDLLWSVVGTDEVGGVTLPDAVSVWGPVPCYGADRTTWKAVDDDRPARLSPEQVGEIDWSLFWHCGGPNSLAHFGIYEDSRLIALSSLSDHGHNIWEIGVDVAPDLKARGLGTAVVGAAGDFARAEGAVL